MKRMTAILAGMMLILGIGTMAQALTLTVTSGTESKTITDGQAGDMSGITGKISFMDMVVGNYLVTVESAQGFSHPYASWPQALHLNAVFTSSIPGGSLTFTLTDSGLSLPNLRTDLSPNALVKYGIGGSIKVGDQITNTVTYSTDGITTQQLPELSLINSGMSFQAEDSALLDLVNPFTLSEVVTIDFGRYRGTSSFDAGVDIIPTPEPATMVLFGAGLLSLAIYCKRRKNV